MRVLQSVSLPLILTFIFIVNINLRCFPEKDDDYCRVTKICEGVALSRAIVIADPYTYYTFKVHSVCKPQCVIAFTSINVQI